MRQSPPTSQTVSKTSDAYGPLWVGCRLSPPAWGRQPSPDLPHLFDDVLTYTVQPPLTFALGYSRDVPKAAAACVRVSGCPPAFDHDIATNETRAGSSSPESIDTVPARLIAARIAATSTHDDGAPSARRSRRACPHPAKRRRTHRIRPVVRSIHTTDARPPEPHAPPYSVTRTLR